MLHYRKLHKFYSLKVFIDTPESIRLMRRIERDKKFRGRTEKSIQSQYCKTVKPMHDKFVQPSKSFSDIILKGTDLIEKLVNQIKTRIDLVRA